MQTTLIFYCVWLGNHLRNHLRKQTQPLTTLILARLTPLRSPNEDRKLFKYPREWDHQLAITLTSILRSSAAARRASSITGQNLEHRSVVNSLVVLLMTFISNYWLFNIINTNVVYKYNILHMYTIQNNIKIFHKTTQVYVFDSYKVPE